MVRELVVPELNTREISLVLPGRAPPASSADAISATTQV
jgi:hypothetical protein